MKFTQFVKQYLATNKDSGLTYRDAMKDDGVRCAYKQFEADLCKKGIVREPEKRPEPKKRYNKSASCGDNVINQYIDTNKENIPPKWSPAPTGPQPQPPSQRPGFPPPPAKAPRASYQQDPFQQMAQNEYWQRNPALLAQARRQYEEAMSQAEQVRDTAEREQQPVPEFILPAESLDGEIPESMMTSPPLSTIPSGTQDSSFLSAPSGLSGTTDDFEFNQSLDPEEESAATPAPPPSFRGRKTQKPKIPPPLMSQGVKEGPQRTISKVEDIPEQELFEIIDEELMNSQAAVSREQVMQELMKAKEDSTALVQSPLQPGGVRFTDEEEAAKLLESIFDYVMDEALEDGGKWTAMLGTVPSALKSVARDKKKAEGKDRKTIRKENVDSILEVMEKYEPVLKAAMERVAEDARQAKERYADKSMQRLEKKKQSLGRIDEREEGRKKAKFGTKEYRAEQRQRIRDGVRNSNPNVMPANDHLGSPPSRGIRPISETMQYRPDVPFAYSARFHPGRKVEGSGMDDDRKDKLKELISALIDVI